MREFADTPVPDGVVEEYIRDAAEEVERAFYEDRAQAEWHAALEPIGTSWRKPFLTRAPVLIAVFAKPYGLGSDGERIRNYYVRESVGIAIGMLVTALHTAGLGALTSTPDYNPFPASACVVQEKLGCSNAGAFDLQAGCTGFVYGLEVARGLVAAGSVDRVLVVGSEVLSTITNRADRNTCVLFGEGAGAAIVEATEGGGHEIVDSWLRSDGSGETSLMRRVAGSRIPFDPERHTRDDFFLTMDGKRVYLFAVDALVRTIRALAERAGMEPDELDWIIPHQANARIIEAAAKRLGLPTERFFMNLDRYANTAAASIPIAMIEMIERGLLEPGQRIITVGFGAALTYGGNLIQW